MSFKTVVPRAVAQEDINEAIDHYLRQAGMATALNFIDALESAFQHIALHPETGSPRYAHELDLQGLRSWMLKGYPHLVSYLEGENHIDV